MHFSRAFFYDYYEMTQRPLKIISVLLLVLAVLAFFIFLAWFFSNIFIYVIISLVVSAILRPLVNTLNRRLIFNIEVPRFLSVFVSFIAFVSLIALFVFLFIPLLSEQVRIFTELIRSETFMGKIFTPLSRLEEMLIRYDLTSESEGFLIESAKSAFSSLILEIKYAEIFTNVISITGSLLVGILAVIFITFFLLYEKGLIKQNMIKMIPNRYFEVSIAALYKIEKLLSNYMFGLIIQMISIFTIAFVGLSIFGIKYAASIALFAAVINLIPYLGPLLGAFFGIFVAISTSAQLVNNNELLFMVIKVIGVFSVVQLTDNMVLQPLIFSKSVKAHPLEIFIIIFAGTTLAGIPGMIAAIPVYTIVRVTAIEVHKGYKSYHIFKV